MLLRAFVLAAVGACAVSAVGAAIGFVRWLSQIDGRFTALNRKVDALARWLGKPDEEDHH